MTNRKKSYWNVETSQIECSDDAILLRKADRVREIEFNEITKAELFNSNKGYDKNLILSTDNERIHIKATPPLIYGFVFQTERAEANYGPFWSIVDCARKHVPHSHWKVGQGPTQTVFWIVTFGLTLLSSLIAYALWIGVNPSVVAASVVVLVIQSRLLLLYWPSRLPDRTIEDVRSAPLEELRALI